MCAASPGRAVQVGPALATEQEAQDRVRLAEDQLLVDERRDLADRVQREERVGPGLLRPAPARAVGSPSSASRKRTLSTFDERGKP